MSRQNPPDESGAPAQEDPLRALDAQARARLRAALEDPDARLVLYMIETPDALLVEVFGPPSEEAVAVLLEQLASVYRSCAQAVAAQQN